MKKLSALGVSAFTESMAMMLQSGIQTDEAIGLLCEEQPENGVLAAGLQKMKQDTESGYSLSEAMERCGIFPSYAVSMVKGADEAGRSDEVLFGLSRYYRDQQSILGKLKNALNYPMLMLVLILLVISSLLVFVLPVFQNVYNSLTGGVAASAFSYVSWAYTFLIIMLVLMAVLLFVLMMGNILWRCNRQSFVKKILIKIPATAGILWDASLVRFFSAFSIYLSMGKTQEQAMASSIPAADLPELQKKLSECLSEMQRGDRLSQSMRHGKIIEPVYSRMIFSGEESGNIVEVLDKLTELYEEDLLNRVDHLVSVVNPVLSGILIVAIGCSLLSVMLPLIGIMNSVG